MTATPRYVQALHEAGHYIVALRQHFKVQHIGWSGPSSTVAVDFPVGTPVEKRLSYWFAGYAAERELASQFDLPHSGDNKRALGLLDGKADDLEPNWFLSRSDTQSCYEVARAIVVDDAMILHWLADDLKNLSFGTIINRRSIPWVEVALGLPLPIWND